MRKDFVVFLKHEGKPIAGVKVEITGKLGGPFSQKTRSDGKVHFSNLPTGEYWLRASLLGIGAADQCFHVSARASSGAKRRMNYVWGDAPLSTRRIAGRLTDSQPGKRES